MINNYISVNTKDFGTFDLETSKIPSLSDFENIDEDFILQHFKAGGIYINDKFVVIDSVKDLVKYFLGFNEGVFFAHNLSYDYRFLFEHLLKNFSEVQHIFCGSKVLSVKVFDRFAGKKNKLLFELRDSYALLPYSLKSLSNSFDIKHKKGYIDFEKEEFNINNVKHIEYLKNDVIGLYEILKKFESKFNLSVKDRYTISSLSFQKWREQYQKNKGIFVRQNSYDNIRNAYHGGRTEVFNHYLENGYYYDIKSSYPYEMKTKKFPVGAYSFHDSLSWEDTKNHMGVIFANVYVPDNHIPLLSYKRDKLYFPTGNFSGWFTSAEIIKARKCGYDFTNMKGYIWDDKPEKIFKDYICEWYKIKDEADKDNDMCLYTISKLFLNSLSGKFGQKKETTTLKMLSDKEKKKIIDKGDPYEIFYDNYCLINTENFISSYAPQISAFITAYGRIRLFNFFEKVGFNNVYYCDTDSLFTDKKMKTGKKLGDLSLVGNVKEAVFLSPKSYGYIDYGSDYVDLPREEEKDHEHIALKGFSTKDYRFSQILSLLFSGGEIEQTRVSTTSVKMFLRRNYPVNSCYKLIRKFSFKKDGKRKNLDEFKTRPFTIEEIKNELHGKR